MRPWGGKSKAEGPTGGTGESLRGAGVARLAIGGRRATWLREARNRPRKRYGPIFSQPQMSLADVEAILGPSEQADYIGFVPNGVVEIKVWHALNGKDRILIFLDKDGRVADM